MSLNLPRYWLVGERPATARENAEGGVDILALDWATGALVPEPGLAPRLFLPDPEVTPIDEAAFLVALQHSSPA